MKLGFLGLLAALLIAVTFGSYDPKMNHLSFEEYLQLLDKPYAAANGCPFQLESRRQIFNANMEDIRQHNKRYELKQETWFKAPNAFTDMTDEEFKAQHLGGYKRTGPSQRQQPKSFLRASSQLTAPNFVDVDWSLVLPEGINQSSPKGCGSCWAHGATNTLYGRTQLKFGKSAYPARQQLVSCAPNTDHCGGTGGCEGSTGQLAYNYVIKKGLSTEAQYPYTSSTTGETGQCFDSQHTPVYGITGHYDLTPNNRTQLIEHIRQGPVVVSVSASNWKSYGGGIFTDCGHYDINHVVTAAGVGFEKSTGQYYYKILNSWGLWGEKGYIRLLMTDPEFHEPCGEDPSPYDGSGCETDPHPRTLACACSGVLYDSTIPTGIFLY